MISLPPPIRHRAIIITFAPTKPRESAVKLHAALKALNTHGGLEKGELESEAFCNSIRHCVISMESDEAAESQFPKVVDRLAEEITGPAEKIVIYYGGHALQHEPSRLRRKMPVQPGWEWHADVEHQACARHLGAFNPVPKLEKFINSIDNNVFLIFHCPMNLHRHFQLELEAPAHRPSKNMQLLHLPALWSGVSQEESEYSSCGVELDIPGGLPCWNDVVANIPAFNENATTQLADQLLSYCGTKVATVHNLLDDLTHAAAEGNQQAPYWVSFLRRVPKALTEVLEESSSSDSSDSTFDTVVDDEAATNSITTHDENALSASEEEIQIWAPSLRLLGRRFLPTSDTERDSASTSSRAPTSDSSRPMVRAPTVVVPRSPRSVAASAQDSGSAGKRDVSSQVDASGPGKRHGGSCRNQNSGGSSSSSSESDDDGPSVDGADEER